MCYSEKLEEANGYMEPNGYVYVGHKALVRFGNALMAPWALVNWLGSMCHSVVDDRQEMLYGFPVRYTGIDYSHAMNAGLAQVNQQYPHAITHFPPHQIVEDFEHGFHLGASRDGAARAARDYGGQAFESAEIPSSRDAYWPSNPSLEPIHAVCKTDLHAPWVICRVLVPANAIGDGNHVHAMMVLPPDERESERDIALGDEWNKKNAGCKKPTHTVDPFPNLTQYVTSQSSYTWHMPKPPIFTQPQPKPAPSPVKVPTQAEIAHAVGLQFAGKV